MSAVSNLATGQGVYDASLIGGLNVSTINALSGTADLSLNKASNQYLTKRTAVTLPTYNAAAPYANGITFTGWFYLSSATAGDFILDLSGATNLVALSVTDTSSVSTRVTAQLNLTYLTGSTSTFTTSTSYALGQWHFFAYTVFLSDPYTAAFTLYMNGSVVTSVPDATGFLAYGTPAPSGILAFGGSPTGAGCLNGKLSDLRMFQRCMSGPEMAILYSYSRNPAGTYVPLALQAPAPTPVITQCVSGAFSSLGAAITLTGSFTNFTVQRNGVAVPTVYTTPTSNGSYTWYDLSAVPGTTTTYTSFVPYYGTVAGATYAGSVVYVVPSPAITSCAVGTNTYAGVSLVVGGNLTGLSVTRSVGGSTGWTAVAGTDASWISVAMSYTGQYQTGCTGAYGTASVIRRSTDYGATWTTVQSGFFFGIAACMSSTGQYQTVLNNGTNIYRSADYGATWTNLAVVANWQRCAMSATGQYQTVTGYANGMYRSTDYGLTWSTVTPVAGNWKGIAMSATGQYQTATDLSGSALYRSINYGATWTLVPGTSSLQYDGVAMSFSGQYQTVTVAGTTNLYRSTDYGVTWSAVVAPFAGGIIAMNATGQYQTIAVEGNQMYQSRDYGATWAVNASSTSTAWRGVSMSSTGQYQTATAFNGKIYTNSSMTYVASAAQLTASGGWTDTNIDAGTAYTYSAITPFIGGTAGSAYGSNVTATTLALGTPTGTMVRSLVLAPTVKLTYALVNGAIPFNYVTVQNLSFPSAIYRLNASAFSTTDTSYTWTDPNMLTADSNYLYQVTTYAGTAPMAGTGVAATTPLSVVPVGMKAVLPFVQNGDFSSGTGLPNSTTTLYYWNGTTVSLSNWTSSNNGSVIINYGPSSPWKPSGPLPPNVTYYLGTQPTGTMDICQNIVFTTAFSGYVNFYHWYRAETPAPTTIPNQYNQVLLNGVPITAQYLSSATYAYKSVPFTVTTPGTYTLTFRFYRDAVDYEPCIAGVSITPSAPTTTGITVAPTAWYQFDNNANIGLDTQGAYTMATNTGTVTTVASTAPNRSGGLCAVFNGSNSLSGTGVNLDNKSFTVCFWSYVTSAITVQTWIYTRSGSGATDNQLLIGYYSSTGFGMAFFSDDYQVPVSPADYLNKWVHYACVYNYGTSIATSTQTVYINGVIAGSRTPTGRYVAAGTTYQIASAYTGYIEDLRVYAYNALDGNYIANIYNGVFMGGGGN